MTKRQARTVLAKQTTQPAARTDSAPCPPRELPAELHHLFRCAGRYPTADAFVTAVHAGACIARGEWIHLGDRRMISGQVVGEGTVTTRKWPAWTFALRGNPDQIEVVPKECAVHVTGCEDPVLRQLWELRRAEAPKAK